MTKKIGIKIAAILLISIIFAVIGYLIAFPISKHFEVAVEDFMFLEGLAILLSTLYFSIQGSPSEVGLSALGQSNSHYRGYEDLEAKRMERETMNYLKKLTKNSIVELSYSGITLVFAAIFIILFSVILV